MKLYPEITAVEMADNDHIYEVTQENAATDEEIEENGLESYATTKAEAIDDAGQVICTGYGRHSGRKVWQLPEAMQRQLAKMLRYWEQSVDPALQEDVRNAKKSGQPLARVQEDRLAYRFHAVLEQTQFTRRSGDEVVLINKIHDRYRHNHGASSPEFWPPIDVYHMLAITHLVDCPLDLAVLHDANTEDFLHDIWGICAHFSRETGHLNTKNWTPLSAKSNQRAAAPAMER